MVSPPELWGRFRGLEPPDATPFPASLDPVPLWASDPPRPTFEAEILEVVHALDVGQFDLVTRRPAVELAQVALQRHVVVLGAATGELALPFRLGVL